MNIKVKKKFYTRAGGVPFKSKYHRSGVFLNFQPSAMALSTAKKPEVLPPTSSAKKPPTVDPCLLYIGLI